jgi:cold shock CspA family protein
MATGRLINWNERGFGFIRPDIQEPGNPRDPDIFVHATALSRSGLDPGTDLGRRVSFDLEHDVRSGRPRAVRLALLPEWERDSEDHPAQRPSTGGGGVVPAAK